MTAETLVALAVFWTAAGVALCLLLSIYPDIPAARDGVRRQARSGRGQARHQGHAGDTGQGNDAHADR